MNINIFRECLMSLKLSKAMSARMVWVDINSLNKNHPLSQDSWSEEIFLKRFSYAIKGNEKFEEIDFSATDTIEAFCERYDAGVNGGGARCGNIGEFQLKGIGKTILAGKRADHWHSYGAFAIEEAVPEILNTIIINSVLPHGAVDCYGLILTGETTAFQPSENGPRSGRGVLLIRDQCLRPAHFFKCEKFKPSNSQKNLFSNESLRIKNLYLSLGNKVGGGNGINEILKVFLERSAEQFACAKISRIFHGAINGSNIALDGRWIDLTTATTVNAGKNYGGTSAPPSFYEEHCTVLNFTEKILRYFNRYNNASLDFNSLSKFYVKKFNDRLCVEALLLLGLDNKASDTLLAHASVKEIAKHIWNIIVDDPDPVRPLPSCIDDNDPLLIVLLGLFNNLIKVPNRKDEDRIESNNENFIFQRKVNEIFLYKYAIDKSTLTFNRYVKMAAVKSLRRVFFSGFFMNKRLERICIKNSLIADLSCYSKLINEVKMVSSWVFKKNEISSAIFFKNESICISYNLVEDVVDINIKGNNHKLVSYGEAELLIDSIKIDLLIAEHDFSVGIKKILETITL